MGNKKNDNNKGFTNVLSKCLVISTVVGIITLLVLSLLFSLIISSGNYSKTLINALSIAVFVTGSLISGFTASKIVGQKGALMGFISGVVYFILYAVIGTVLNGFSFTTAIFLKLVISVFSSAIGGILGVNLHRKEKY